jgi:hypothetical protein
MQLRSLWKPRKGLFKNKKILAQVEKNGFESIVACNTCQHSGSVNGVGCQYSAYGEKVDDDPTKIKIISSCSGSSSIYPISIISKTFVDLVLGGENVQGDSESKGSEVPS